MPVPHRELPTRLRVELLEARLTPAAFNTSAAFSSVDPVVHTSSTKKQTEAFNSSKLNPELSAKASFRLLCRSSRFNLACWLVYFTLFKAGRTFSSDGYFCRIPSLNTSA